MSNLVSMIRKTGNDNYGGNKRGDLAVKGVLKEIEYHFAIRKGHSSVDTINRAAIEDWKRILQEELKNSPSRVNTKLSILRQVFIVAGVPMPKVANLPRSKRPLWALSPEQEQRLMEVLKAEHAKLLEIGEMETAASYVLLMDYIEWAIEVGLRVEETLRLKPIHFINMDTLPSVEVPGTKTNDSNAMVPLSKRAAEIALKRMEGLDQDSFLFAIEYLHLKYLWDKCRRILGLTTEKSATLKGLRRTFASRLAKRHIPPAMLQQLMRHSSLSTTSIYLNVFGMAEHAREFLEPDPYSTEEPAAPPPPPQERAVPPLSKTDLATKIAALYEAGLPPAAIAAIMKEL